MMQLPKVPWQNLKAQDKVALAWLLFLILISPCVFSLRSCNAELEKMFEKEPAVLEGVVRSIYYNQQTGWVEVNAVVTNTMHKPFAVDWVFLYLNNAYGQNVAGDFVSFNPPKILQPGESVPVFFKVIPISDLQNVKQAVVRAHGWLLLRQ